MKIKELLRESDDSTPDYSESVNSLVGQEFEFAGVTHKILSVDQRKSFGQNYNIKVSPAFDKGHPYGTSKQLTRMFSKWVGGLSFQFSESGMQGKSTINMDVSAPSARPPNDAKQGIEAMKDLAIEAGYKVLFSNPNNYVITKKGKGKLMLAYIPATEHEDDKFSVQKLESWGYAAVKNDDNIDKMLQSMKTGSCSKYFTMPKAPKE